MQPRHGRFPWAWEAAQRVHGWHLLPRRLQGSDSTLEASRWLLGGSIALGSLSLPFPSQTPEQPLSVYHASSVSFFKATGWLFFFFLILLYHFLIFFYVSFLLSSNPHARKCTDDSCSPQPWFLVIRGQDLRVWPKSGHLGITDACARGGDLGVFVAEPSMEAK